MLKALELFRENIKNAKHLTSLYEYLEVTLKSPLSFDDLLRSQIVYSVSAFDKLLHDIIRIGMLEIYTGKRQPTPKYETESIPISTHIELLSATIPPKESIFEQTIIKKLKIISFQEPDKISDGLSYIWNEKQKWQQIARKMGIDDKTVKTELKLIANRRNIIVHEADIDPSTEKKYAISKNDCQFTTNFLCKCGESIVDLVI